MKRKVVSALLAVSMLGTMGVAAHAEEARGHLNAALFWFGDNMDPAQGWNGWTLTRAGVGENLVTVNENMEIVGQIADSWEVLDDTTWKFHIREGVTFQNGNPVTAEAVKASIERSLEMNERGQTNLKVKSIETEGDDYVIFTTEDVYGAFLGNLSEPLFIIVDTTADTDSFVDTPICTGPYMVTSYEDDISFECVAYDGYWGGTPALESMTVYNIGDDNTRATALQSGDIDMCQGLTAAELPMFEGNDDFQIQSATGTRVDLMFMNADQGPLSDKNVRLAVNAAVNYEAVAMAMGEGTTVAGSPYPASTPYGYDELNKAKYDPEAAAEYLAAAGYEDTDGDGYVDKDGAALELRIMGNSGAGGSGTDTTLSQLVQSQLEACKIKATIEMVENVEDRRSAGDFDLLFANWQTASTGDPQWFLDQVFKTGATDNYGKYSNADLDAVIEKLSQTLDYEERCQLTKEASQIIIDEGFGCYLVSAANFTVSNSKVENMVTFPIDYYMMTADTSIAE